MNLKFLLLLCGIFLKTYANELSDREIEEQSVLWPKIVFNKLNKLLDYNAQLSKRLDNEELLIKKYIDEAKFKVDRPHPCERSEELFRYKNTNGAKFKEENDGTSESTSNDPNNWIVIQRRQDPSVNFNRTWNEYKTGFGDRNGDFFIGLEKLHKMTTKIPHKLRVEIRDNQNNMRYAQHDKFVIGSESEAYALKTLGKFSGCFTRFYVSSDTKFSTFDKINYPLMRHLKEKFNSGWWHSVAGCNLNGMTDGKIHCRADVIKSSIMMIRPN